MHGKNSEYTLARNSFSHVDTCPPIGAPQRIQPMAIFTDLWDSSLKELPLEVSWAICWTGWSEPTAPEPALRVESGHSQIRGAESFASVGD